MNLEKTNPQKNILRIYKIYAGNYLIINFLLPTKEFLSV